jgi:hypothetical protein
MPSPSIAIPASPLKAIRTLQAVFSRQGTIVASWRTYNGRKLGPYYRLAYRTEGRQRSIYLGKSKNLLRQVRRLLEKLQKPIKTKRFMQRAQKTFQEVMKKHKAQFRIDLLKVGLQLRGYAVRGWRRWRALGAPRTPLGTPHALQCTPHAPRDGVQISHLSHMPHYYPSTQNPGPDPRNRPFATSVDQKGDSYE